MSCNIFGEATFALSTLKVENIIIHRGRANSKNVC
jgi:hypothetical protein